MIRIVIALLLVACFTPGLVRGGDLQDFSDILENKIKSSEATWKLVSKHFEQEGNVLIIIWQNTPQEKEEYFAVIRATPSNAAAVKEIAQLIFGASAGVGAKIQGIGQEAYLAQLSRGARIQILFRQSNFVVTLMAPSEPKGRGLAKYIIDSIATFQRRK